MTGEREGQPMDNPHAVNASKVTLMPGAPGWTIEIEVESASDLGVCYHANFQRAGLWMCRIALAGPSIDEASAYGALASRACDWIAGFEARDAQILRDEAS